MRDKLLVDCGATVHIVRNKANFSHLEEDLEGEHVLEMADGTQPTGVVRGRGLAHFLVYDKNGKQQQVTL